MRSFASALLIVALMAALCDGARMRRTNVRRAVTYEMTERGQCDPQGGCQPITTIEECKKAVGELGLAAKAAPPVAKSWTAKFMARMAIFAAPEPNWEPVDECQGRGRCTRFAHGCVYRKEASQNKIVFNGAATSKATASIDKPLICSCNEAEKSPPLLSMGACGKMQLSGATMDVVEIYSGERPEQRDEQGRLLEVPMATSMRLDCAWGYSFTGVHGGERAVKVDCNQDTGVTVTTGVESGRVFGEGSRDCFQNKCDMSILQVVDVRPDGDDVNAATGLYKAEFAIEQAEGVAFAHGDNTGPIGCLEGYTFDAKPPTMENFMLNMECLDGLFYPVEHPEKWGLTFGSQHEVLGIACTPVECPMTAAIFRDTNTELLGTNKFTSQTEPVDIVCHNGFELCLEPEGQEAQVEEEQPSGDEEAPKKKLKWCPAGQRLHEQSNEPSDLSDPSKPDARSFSVVCKADGTYSDPRIDRLKCTPVECDKVHVGNPESYEFLDPEKDLEEPRSLPYYTFDDAAVTPLEVEVTCNKGYNLDGDAKSTRQSAKFVCGAESRMEFSAAGLGKLEAGEEPATAPQDGDLCKPIGCKPLATQKHDRSGRHGIRNPVAEDANAEQSKAVIAHDETLELKCEPGYSYNGQGRYVDEQTKFSTWKRTLQCKLGAYICTEGYCHSFTHETSNNQECREIVCTIGAKHIVDEWNIIWAGSAMAQGLEDQQKLMIGGFIHEDALQATCNVGFKVAGKAHGVNTFDTICEDEWKPSALKFDGWSPAFEKCEKDPEFCVELTAEWYTTHSIQPLDTTGRHFGDMVELTCEPGFTVDDTQAKKEINQKVECVSSDDMTEGKWWSKADTEPVVCKPITCLLPEKSIYNAMNIEVTGPCLGKEIDCHPEGRAIAHQKIAYTCGPGHHFALFDGEANDYPGATNREDPTELALECQTDGMVRVDAPHAFRDAPLFWKSEEIAITPKCIPVMCAESSADVIETFRSVALYGSGDPEQDKAHDNLVNLLKLTYTWMGAPSGLTDRVYTQTSVLECNDNTKFKMVCKDTGLFEIQYTGAEHYGSVAEAAQPLVTACGRQLVVQNTAGGQQRCLALIDDNKLALAECQAVATQMWWFDKLEHSDCSAKTNGDLEVHNWEFCGELRSLKAQKGENVCIMPSAEDDGSAPVVGKCDGSVTWKLDSSTSALMMGIPAEGQKFRRHNYLSARTDIASSLTLVMDDYFSPLAEMGFQYAQAE